MNANSTSVVLETLEPRQLLSTVQPVAEPALLVSNGGWYPLGRKVVADGQGNLVATWLGPDAQGTGGGMWLQALRSDGSPRSAPVNIEPVGWSANLAVSGDGSSVVLTWWGEAGSNFVSARLFSIQPIGDGDEVTIGLDNAAFTVAQAKPPKNNILPVVAMNDAGAFTIAWVLGGTASDSVVAQRFSSGGSPLGKQITVSSGSGFRSNPSIDMDGAGRFVVAWHGPDGSGQGIFAQRFSADGKALGRNDFPINSIKAGDQTNAKVAVWSGGGFAVAWEGPDDDGKGIYARRFNASGQPVDANDVQVNLEQAGNQFAPAIDAGPNGTFVVTWTDSQLGGIYAQAFDGSGNRLTDAFGNENILVRQGLADMTNVVLQPDGRFWVIWCERASQASNTDVFCQQFEIL